MYKYKFAVAEKSAADKSYDKMMWAVSGIFFAFAVVTAFIFYSTIDYPYAFYYEEEKFAIILLLMLTAVYTISGIIIRRRVDISLIKMIFWQSGGFINVIAGIITANMFFLDECTYVSISVIGFWYIALPLITFYEIGLIVFLPALEISFIIQAVVGLIMKKIHLSKTAAKENIEENNEKKIIQKIHKK